MVTSDTLQTLTMPETRAKFNHSLNIQVTCVLNCQPIFSRRQFKGAQYVEFVRLAILFKISPNEEDHNNYKYPREPVCNNGAQMAPTDNH